MDDLAQKLADQMDGNPNWFGETMRTVCYANKTDGDISDGFEQRELGTPGAEMLADLLTTPDDDDVPRELKNTLFYEADMEDARIFVGSVDNNGKIETLIVYGDVNGTKAVITSDASQPDQWRWISADVLTEALEENFPS